MENTRKPVTVDEHSHYRRISFVEGLSKERFYQLGQYIRSEQAYVYSINNNSTKKSEKYTISLITSDNEVFEWYEYVRGSGDSVTLQLNTKYISTNQNLNKI